MFELVRNGTKNYFNINVDGVTYLYSRAYYSKDQAVVRQFISNDRIVNKALAKCRLEDFGVACEISLGDVLNSISFSHSITLSFSYGESNRIEESKIPDELDVDFCFNPSLSEWKEKYSFNEFYTELKKHFHQSDVLKGKIDFYQQDEIAFDFSIAIKNFSTSIEELLLPYLIETEIICEKVLIKLNNKIIEDSILQTFNFPHALKIPCEQYLLSFIQFLRDLGTNATPNLKEVAGKVLFSITPTDDIEALEKIREALAIYLSLSSNPIPHSTGDRTVDMILSGARANAKHFESQLELAFAKLQFKDATLELKDATIEQNQFALRQRDETIKDLKEMLAKGNIFEESLEKVVINGEVVEESSLYRFSREDAIEVEATPILDEKTEETKIGLVKFHEVTKLKDYGVSFDLAKAIKDLMDYFKQNKNK